MTRTKELRLLEEIRNTKYQLRKSEEYIVLQKSQISQLRQDEVKHAKILLFFAALLTLSLITNLYLIFR